MEALQVAKAIEAKIALLDDMQADLPGAIDKFCVAASEYDKSLAIAIVKLRNGAEVEIDAEHKIKNPPASVTERLAKGMCYQERLNMDVADQELRALKSKLEIAMAQLNGYQSINRYLAEI